jgi:magnesium-transporting ATPase (P-type)
VEYDEPNADLYKLNGILSTCLAPKPVPISMDNVLLRGTTVKSSGFIYGVVLYTGPDSRLSRNSTTLKQNKFSTVDQ